MRIVFELLSLGRLDDVIGIEPKRIIAGGPRQCRIAGRGEVVDPDKIKHTCPERPGDLDRAVGAAGIDDDDLIEQPAHRFETGGKVFFLVPNNHGQADSGPVVRDATAIDSQQEEICPQISQIYADENIGDPTGGTILEVERRHLMIWLALVSRIV